MEDAIHIFPAFADAYSVLGYWYFQDHRFHQSAEIFKQAYNKCRDGKKLFALPLAKSLLYDMQVTDALALMHAAGVGNEALRAQAAFIQQAINKPWKDSLYNVKRVNSSFPEFFPWLSPDGKKLYFTRRRFYTDEDFYVSRPDTCGGWLNPQNMGMPFNGPEQEATLAISADGHYMFITRCDNRSENGWGQGGCDLYMCYTADSVWSVPESFGGTINTPGYEGMACLSPDNRELYFVSDREGGYGGLDIWTSRFENGLWQLPKNLGPAVNTAGNETAPFLHMDNRTLYFSSNGHTGMGGNDLFMSKRINDSTWTEPVNMGYPINTTADENSICVSRDGKIFFFASDRESAAGNFDLYEMLLPDALKPVAVIPVKGYVYDSLTEERLNFASIYISEAGNPDQPYHITSNRGDGSFMIPLPAGKQFALRTHRVMYQDFEGTLDLSDTTLDLNEPYRIALLPQDYVAPMSDSLLLTINFPLNSTKLTDTNKANISRNISPWLFTNTGSLIFYINGYTDNSGTPMLNEQLSYTRAQLVADEIISMGIDPINVHVQGWGDANPVSDNDAEAGRDRNRRVEVIIRR